jgi:hypothetical protein
VEDEAVAYTLSGGVAGKFGLSLFFLLQISTQK